MKPLLVSFLLSNMILSRTTMELLLDVLAALLIGLLTLIIGSITLKACVDYARRRGKSPFFVIVAVIFFFPWDWSLGCCSGLKS
jgi:hypothetical protein